jgi:Ni,Fe-hydrogenase I large subunit
VGKAREAVLFIAAVSHDHECQFYTLLAVDLVFLIIKKICRRERKESRMNTYNIYYGCIYDL